MHFFDRAYEGIPPWEIGGPQPEFVRLCEGGEIVGRVLDVGCGTGENAIFFATHGHPTWGVDFAPNAIQRARSKVAGREVPVTFRVADALDLAALEQRFDTVTDCGLFHTLSDEDRPAYAASVHSALLSKGRLFILCFSDEEPTDWGGPRRISQAELRTTFRRGWVVRAIAPARFGVTMEGVGGRAWLARIERSPS